MNARIPALLAALLLGSSPWLGATNFAILLSSGIQGECDDPAFPGGIEVESFTIDGPVQAGSAGRFTVHKVFDKSSPQLILRCAKGKHIAKAQLVLREPAPPGVPGPRTFCLITLQDVLVSSWKSSGDAGGPQRESFELTFSRVFFQYYADDSSLATAYLSLDQGGPDSDGDGMSDPYEEYYGLDPMVANTDDDSDGDGLSDLDEARLGFNPVAGDSFFACSAGPSGSDPGQLDLAWDAVPGKTYQVQWTPDLAQAFQTIATVTAESTRVTQPVVRQGMKGFFRVVPVLPD